MKIGVDIRVLMDRQYSGIGQYTACLLKELFNQVDDNQYRLFYNSWRNIRPRLIKWSSSKSQLIGGHWPNKVFNYLNQKCLARPKLDQFLGGVDLFWSPHFNFTRLSPQTKHILTIHDLSFLRYPEFFSRRKNIWHRSLNIYRLAREARALVAVSENTRDDIVELLNVPAEKVRVIYSGLEAVSPLPEPDIRQQFLKTHDLGHNFILYLGNIEPRKNIVGLIYAYNLLRDANINLVDVKLVLAGAAGWKNRKIFQAWQDSPYKQQIKFLGYVSPVEKEILYHEANLFAYPSFYEGFGFPPLEAMARGLPVITSNVSSLPEVVGEAAITVNPYDVNDLAKAMELVIFDSRLREQLIIEGKARAKQFSWQKSAAEYLALFKSL